ncbi:MAG: bifunctional 4-hydroxy-2-oxoglutarate aldolase/2-dehydro-3-deoxy-phosphogluconate aldolase, partial [Panacibacter sp.]
MRNIENIINTIKEQGIVPLFYHDDLEVSVEVIHALYKAGVRIVEYTNRGTKALYNFKALLQIRTQWPGLYLS